MSPSKNDRDVAAYDEARRRIDSGEDELIPAQFADRILAGESPLRVWREYRGLSAEELAGRAGVGSTDLMQIEQGKPGDREVLERIARALGISLDDLV